MAHKEIEQSAIYKDMPSEVDKVLKIFTFPVTNVTAERSFSPLMRLKTYLRSTMTHCRLNYLFTQQELMHPANLEKIAEDYILVLFWKNFINSL